MKKLFVSNRLRLLLLSFFFFFINPSSGSESPKGKMLFVIGLGLGDETDVTVKGKQAIEGCARIYLEHYTSILGASQERLVR